MTTRELTQSLKTAAIQLGFSFSGICSAAHPPGIERFYQWLSAGYAGEMSYLTERKNAYAHPDSVLQGVRSILMLGLNYDSQPHRAVKASHGWVSKYAWGTADYHDLIHAKLKKLKRLLLEKCPRAQVRGVVDTAPLLEREFAILAGLGWAGKNTLLIHKQHGSLFFLAALLTDVELHADSPFRADHCGTCRACLDACPTSAFVQPYVLDATKCISYLTIENRGAIPVPLRPGIGDWLFGCDICQDVCPWNRRAPQTQEPSFMPQPESDPINLLELFDLDDESFRQRFRKTPLWRPKRRGILRNAAIVLGNQRLPTAVPALTQGLHDREPVVRGAAAWALGQVATERAKQVLEQRLEMESEQSVVAEIKAALAAAPKSRA